jgi:ubiquinone/menaquinone biosynthesis C-methylase UbiE
MSDPVSAFGDLHPDRWLDVLKRSVHETIVDGVPMPRFPDEQVQLAFNGSAFEAAMEQAHAFWLHTDGLSRALQAPLGARSSVLDIGCGWGRVTRTFMKDVPAGQIFGVDIHPRAIALCRDLAVPGAFTQVTAGAPLPFADASFTIATAFSVFTHLPEAVATDLIAETARVLRPGGLAVLTVEDRSFLELIGHPDAPQWGERWRLLSQHAPRLDDLRQRYAAGDYLYLVTNDSAILSPDIYGDAVVPKAWIEANWTRAFDLIAYVPAAPPIRQAVVALRKRG